MMRDDQVTRFDLQRGIPPDAGLLQQSVRAASRVDLE